MKNYLRILPDEIIYYIFEYCNPYKEYSSNHILKELNMQYLIKNQFINRNYTLTTSGFTMKNNIISRSPFNFELVYDCLNIIEKCYVISEETDMLIHAISGRSFLQRQTKYKFNHRIDLGTFIISMVLSGQNHI